MKSDAGRREHLAQRLLFWAQLLLVSGFIIYRAYVGIQTPGTIISRDVIPIPQPEKTDITIKLIRGPLKLLHFVPGDPYFAAHPKAVIVFGSGDGGWGGWEDRVSRALQADGCEVISFDCLFYSKTDYDLPTLQADMNTIAHAFPRTGPMPPVILGGWSMGADQAVAAAGGPNRPGDVVGLLLISPSNRSRYGEREPDRWNVPPTGPGTFALGDFADKLKPLRVAQWNANLDLLASDQWVSKITTVHKASIFSPAFHEYNGACDAFLARLKKTVDWILSNQP